MRIERGVNAGCCPEWNRNIAQLDKICDFATVVGLSKNLEYRGGGFKFCPWCGKPRITFDGPSSRLAALVEGVRHATDLLQKMLAESDKVAPAKPNAQK